MNWSPQQSTALAEIDRWAKAKSGKQVRAFGVIYLITNIKNGKKYVGITTQTARVRWRQHRLDARPGRSTFPIHNAIRRYGIENFSFEVVAHACSTESLHAAERHWIKICRSLRPHDYNLTGGGQGTSGYRWNFASRQRMAISTKKRWQNICARQAVSQQMKTHFSNLANRLKMSLRKKVEYADPLRITAHRKRFGRDVSIDGVTYSTLRMAAETLGVARSTIQYRISIGLPGYQASNRKPVRKGKTGKAVRVDGILYASMPLAAETLGITSGLVWKRIGRGFPGYEYGDGTRFTKLPPRPKKAMPVVISGVRYRSASAAGAAIGADAALVLRRLHAGHTDFKFADTEQITVVQG